MLHYIITNWPDSKYAHLARVRLAQGFPPFHDEPTMRPTITPSPTPTPFGMTPSPSPTPVPTATPTETPSPTPTPTPTRRPAHGLFGHWAPRTERCTRSGAAKATLRRYAAKARCEGASARVIL